MKAKLTDIVITGNGGAPLDQNMYQAVKSMTAAEACANEGGVIIECAECADGTGGEGFYRALKDCASAQALMDEILQVPQNETKPDQFACPAKRTGPTCHAPVCDTVRLKAANRSWEAHARKKERSWPRTASRS